MDQVQRRFPVSAGILFGLGLGGFFDGIVLHLLLQWHKMLSSWYPLTPIENFKLNTLWDGIFHSLTYLFVLAGLVILWRRAHRQHLRWSSRMLVGSMLLGFGVFKRRVKGAYFAILSQAMVAAFAVWLVGQVKTTGGRRPSPPRRTSSARSRRRTARVLATPSCWATYSGAVRSRGRPPATRGCGPPGWRRSPPRDGGPAAWSPGR